MEADGEWSDGSDDALRSGSATDIGPSDGEELNNDEKKMATTNRLLKSDPVNAILDKIDAELGAMNSGPVTMSKSSPKSVSKEKSKSEDSKQNTKSKLVPLNNGNTLQGVNKRDMKAKDGDHCPSDLDSAAAEQIDEKFKEIMKKKRGGYLEDLNKQQSDNETIKTEDFENKFKSSLIHNKVAEDLNQTKSPCKIQQKTTIPQALPPRNIYYASDMESVKTEDFESKFSDLLIRDNTMIKSSVPTARIQTPALSTAASGSKPSLQQPTSGGPITDKKSSDRKIQFFENGHVHLPSDPVLKKKESSPRRMLSDYGRTTPSSDACSNSTLANGHVPYSSVNGHTPNFNGHTPNFNGHIPNSSTNVHTPHFIGNGQSPATNPLKGNSSHGAMANQVSTSPTNNGVLSAANSTIPSFSRSLPVTSVEKLKVNGKMDSDSVDETCREIERESARIQLEMGKERRSASPARMSTNLTVLSPISFPSVSKTPESFSFITDEKTAMEKEVKLLREALHRSKLELRECETNLKDTREKAENARTQLMLTEFKRHNTEKDLDRLNEELEKQKSQSDTFNSQIQEKLNDVQEFRSLGLSVTEVRHLKEENSTLRMKCRNSETIHLERDELVRQLNAGKEDLFHEQKQGRIQKEELQLEVESLTSQLEEVQSTRDELQTKLLQLQSNYRQSEQEKNAIIQQKFQENEALKEKLKHDRSDSRHRFDQELMTSQQEVKDLRVRLGDLEERNKEKDELNLKLRDQNIELQQLLAKEEEAREAILKDHKRSLLNFRKETDSAMMQLRESLFLEKQTALENLREEIESDRKESVKKNDEKLTQVMTENMKIISSKNDEISKIQILMKNLEEERRQLHQKAQEEIQQQVTQAVTRERTVMETEREWAVRRERETLVSENNRKIDEISTVLQQEKAVKEEIKQQLKVAQQELEEQKTVNRQSNKDKMVAVARAKEMMREQTSADLTRFKDKIKDESKNEMTKLKDEVKSLEIEVEKLREEKQGLCRVEREFNHTLDRTERTVINEINEECRRSASVLGISPRKVHLANFKKESPAVNETKSSKYRTPITSSLANLRACNEELRTHLYEIKQEVDSLRSLLNKAQKEKEESLETLRRKLEKEKTDELDHLKERLVREHISQMNRLANQYISEPITSPDPVQSLITSPPQLHSTPKSDFYIERFQQGMKKEFLKYSSERAVSPELKHINDLQQEEIARLEREIQKLSLNRSGNRKPPRPKAKKELGSDKLGEKLPYKLHHFDTEPLKLQSNLYTGSVPDLSNPALYRQVPLKARLSAERDDMESALFTDPDPELSQIFLPQNRKLSEMNKLQTTLTNQNKELLELERAYNQLNRSYNQRSASPSIHFRSSR